MIGRSIRLGSRRIASISSAPDMSGSFGLSAMQSNWAPRRRANASSPVATAVVGGDDVNRNVTRLRVVLQSVEHRPPVAVGQTDVERDHVRFIAMGQPQRG